MSFTKKNFSLEFSACFPEETNEIYYLKKNINSHEAELQEARLYYKCVSIEFEETLFYLKKNIMTSEAMLSYLYKRLNSATAEYSRYIVLMNRILSENNNFDILISKFSSIKLFNNYRYKLITSNVIEVLRKYAALYNKSLINLEIKKNLNKELFNTQKYNYSLLEIENNDYLDLEFDDEKYFFNQFNYRLFMLGARATGISFKQIKKCKKFIFSSELRDDSDEYIPEEPKFRNIFLLDRLRSIIESFRLRRMPHIEVNLFRIRQSVEEMALAIQQSYYRWAPPDYEEAIEMTECYNHQMEEPSAHGVSNLKSDKKSNVILTQSRDEDKAVTATTALSLESFCSSDISDNFKNIVDRWMVIKSFEWNTSQLITTSESSAFQIFNLPYDAIKNEPNTPCRMPNCAPFTFHRYWKGDIEVKIQVNSNKFQIGSLQCAWLYEPDYDNFYKNRINVYSMSQVDHVIVNASASNEASLYIPFKHHLPFIHTKNRSDMPQCLHMGRLFINVLNNLTTTNSGPTKCQVSVFVRFPNSVFTGMLSGDIDPIEHQMEKILTDVASTVLTSYLPDVNRDNPAMPGPPMYVVPTASHSWAIGTGLGEPLHPLRLDGRGQTPHPPSFEKIDEMDVKVISRKFGLIKTLTWDLNSTTLFTCDAAPLLEKNKYFSINPTTYDELMSFVIPPVGVISSMYMGWRGTLEFRFDIVASQFHTGRLIVGYVPGATTNTRVSVNQLRASPHVVFTLQEDNQFTFNVPYIANKPIWYRTQSGDYTPEDALAPSRLYVCVLNALVPMESIPNKVYINVYMRAGEDFECFIPVQPAIGLAFNRKFVANSGYPSIIHSLTGYSPYYSGIFEDLTKAQCFRWGTLSHQIAKFNGQNYYDSSTKIVSWCEIKSKIDNFTYYGPGGNHTIEYAVFIYLDQLGYVIGVPCISSEAAFHLACHLFRDKKQLNANEVLPWVVRADWSATNNTYSGGDPQWIVKEKVCDVFEHQGERENASSILSTGLVANSNFGRLFFGENFKSLKDLCRRYQYYGCYIITDINVKDNEKVKFSFAVLPQGLDLVLQSGTNTNQLLNRCRDGHIPIIASGFRYYRGGIRFRIILDPKFSVSVIVQHRPDRRLKSLKVETSTLTTGSNIANHSYGSYIQVTNVNGIIEFEVPFYQLGAFGLLQRPIITKTDETNYYSLGDLSINLLVDATVAKNVQSSMISMYYSIADDMNFSTFQGFPPVVFCNSVPPASDNVKGMSEFEILDHQMFNPFKWMSDKVVNSVESTVIERVTNGAANYLDTLDSCVKKYDNDLQRSYFSIGLEILHVMSDNGSIKSICFAIVKILLELKFIVVTDIMQLVSVLSASLRGWINKASPNEVISDDSMVPEVLDHQMMVSTFDVKTWIPLLGMFFVGTCTALNLSCEQPSSMKGYAKMFSKNLPQNLKSGSFVMSFLHSCIDIVKMFVNYIVKKIYPVESWYYSLEASLPSISKWCDEVFYLDSLDLEDELMHNNNLYDRVYYCYLFGRRMLVQTLDVDRKDSAIIMRVIEKISSIYEKMTNLGKHPFIRREPYCLWMSGKPGIGKSYLTEYITSVMLKEIKYKLKGSKIFTIMPAGEYWTGCKNQPVLNMDDAFSIEQPEALMKDLNTMYMVKSPVALNPPMAALEEKHLRYNPEIFYINSNKDFPKGNFNEAAVHRRVDMRIRAQVVDPSKKEARHYDRDVIKDFKHLEFFVAADPGDQETAFEGPYSLVELLDIVRPHFKEFFLHEIENFEYRLSTYSMVDTVTITRDDAEHYMHLSDIVLDDYQKQKSKYREDLRNSLYYKAKQSYDWLEKVSGSIYSESKEYFKSFFDCQGHENVIVNETEVIGKVREYFTIHGEITTEFLTVIFELYGITDFDEFLNMFDSNEKVLWMEVRKTVNIMRFEASVVNWDGSLHDGDERRSLSISDSIVMNERRANNLAQMKENLKRSAVSQVDRIEEGPLNIAPISIKNIKKKNSKPPVTSIVLEPTVRILESPCVEEKAKECDLSACVTLESVIQNCLDIIKEQIVVSKFSSDELLLRCGKEKIQKSFAAQLYAHCRITVSSGYFSYLTAWYKLFNILAIGLQDVYDCKHLTSLCIEWDRTKRLWVVGEQEVADKCCGTECLFTSNFFRKMYTWNAIMCKPDTLFLYRNKTFDQLPDMFRPSFYICFKEKVKSFLQTISEKFKLFLKKLKTPAVCFLKMIGYMSGFILGLVGILTGVAFGAHLLGYSLGPIGSMITSITGITVGRVAGVAVEQAVSDAFENPAVVIECEKNASELIHESAYNLPQQIITTPSVPVVNAHQSDQCYNSQLRRLNRNFCIIRCAYIDERGVSVTLKARCLGIIGNKVLILKHYHDEFMNVPRGSKFTLDVFGIGIKGQQILTINYRDLKIDIYKSTAAGYTNSYLLLHMPPSVPLFPSIINMFAPVKSLSYISRECDFFEFGVGITKDLKVDIGRDYYIREAGCRKPARLHTAWNYSKSGAGLCGSVLLDKRFESPIIGMHVAGGSNFGLADVLYREMFDHLKPIIVDVEQPNVVAGPVEEKIAEGIIDHVCPKAQVDLDNCMLKYGVIENQMMHRETGRTRIEPSVIHGVFEVRTEPNPLKVTDPRLPKGCSPMKEGCEKHGMPVMDFETKDLEIVGNDMLQVLKLKCIPVRKHVSLVSLEDAICGNVNVPHFEPLEWNTSPGYGFVHIRPRNASGKKWLFDLEETSEGYKLNDIKRPLVDVMLKKHKMREQGIVPCTVFTDCLKDTCILKESCSIPGKTRIFSISPVDFTIQFKQFFGDFLAAYTHAKFDVESAIGIDVMSGEWTDLALLLQKKGSHVVTGDYKNFGPGLSTQVASCALDLIIEWYKYHKVSEDHLKIMYVMKHEILNSYHLCFNLIYQVFCGIPSGSPITTPLNNLVNCLYIRLMWLNIFKDTSFEPMSKFHECVTLVCYGDDLIMNVREEILDKFNCSTLQKMFQKYGITFTDSGKNLDVVKWVNLEQSTFLSGAFVLHPTRPFTYLYGLKKTSIEGLVNWVRTKNQSNLVATKTNCFNGSRYAFGWGKDYYNYFISIVQQALEKQKISMVFDSWDQLDRLMFNDKCQFEFLSIPIIDFN